MKIIWIAVIISIAAGLVLAVVGLSMGASTVLYWDGARFQTADNSENISRITEPDTGLFRSIEIGTSFSDVEFIIADKYGIDACGYNLEWSWSLENEVLKITQTHNNRSGIRIIDFGWASRVSGYQSLGQNYLKIYLPDNAELETVTIGSDSGDIKLGGFRADSVQIKNSFGDIKLSAVECDNLKLDMDSGSFTCTDLNARTIFYSSSFGDGSFQGVTAERFTSDRDSGDLDLKDCEFGDIVITSSFGELTARNLVSRGADIQSDSGDIKLEGDFTGNTILRVNFGDVRLSTSREREEYSYEISTHFGDIKFGGDRFGDSASVISGGVSDNHIKITASSGDVEVSFAK